MTNAPTFIYQPESWMDSAACVGHDPAWWFPDDRCPPQQMAQETRAAKAICASCPVQTKCLDYAMRCEPGWMKFGIYGALTADARRNLKGGAA